MFLQVKFEFSLSYKVHDIVMTNYEVKDAKGRNYPLNKRNQFINLPWVTAQLSVLIILVKVPKVAFCEFS